MNSNDNNVQKSAAKFYRYYQNGNSNSQWKDSANNQSNEESRSLKESVVSAQSMNGQKNLPLDKTERPSASVQCEVPTQEIESIRSNSSPTPKTGNTDDFQQICYLKIVDYLEFWL
mgnify:CR=1 FL=1